MKSPYREETHSPVDLNRLMKLGVSIDDAAEDEEIEHSALDDLAYDAGEGIERFYAACALTTDVKIKREHDVAFEVCVGKCQAWGALPMVESLTKQKEALEEKGSPSFDIVAKSCLDKCNKAAVVMAKTPSGTVLLEEATIDDVKKAVEELCV